MLIDAPLKKVFSEAEYFDREERASQKHEFLNGKILEMPGGTSNHSLIATNITTALNNALEDRADCFVFNSDIKIQIPRYKSFVYPDALVVCEVVEYYEGRKDVIVNPILIVEVLSHGTSDYDKGDKFLKYKTLASFKEYVLVEQDEPSISTFYKQRTRLWEEDFADGLEASIYLKSIDVTLPLSKVYKKVIF
ncbi:MAG: hypothetical protein RLZZ292_1912 [Bacteroidota bacterium]